MKGFQVGDTPNEETLTVEVTAYTKSAALADAVAQGKAWFETECVYATLGEQLSTEATQIVSSGRVERVDIQRTFEATAIVVHQWRPTGGVCQRCGEDRRPLDVR